MCLRPKFPLHSNAAEGTKLIKAVGACTYILKGHPCPFKVGMARSLGTRWQMYQESDGWRPSHLFIVGEVQGREAAGYLEAGLIRILQDLDVPADYKVNLKNKDNGGTGPRAPEHFDSKYVVYLAVDVQIR